MHQNGRDTHVRQMKVFGPREHSTALPESFVCLPEFETLEMSMYSTIR